MQLPVTSSQNVFIPLRGPAGVDLTQYTVDVAIVSETAGEPASGDWKAATWQAPAPGAAKEATLFVTAGDYPTGSYMAYARLHASPELVVLKSGRVKVGNP